MRSKEGEVRRCTKTGNGCIEGKQRPLHLCSMKRRCLLLLYDVELNA